MRYLLDTHIWLWMLREPHKLSSLVHQTLYEPSNERYLSPISIWEVTVLLERKRITMQEDFRWWFAPTSDLSRESRYSSVQIFLKEGRDALAGVRGRIWTITLLVVWVLKGVARGVINLDVRDFSA